MLPEDNYRRLRIEADGDIQTWGFDASPNMIEEFQAVVGGDTHRQDIMLGMWRDKFPNAKQLRLTWILGDRRLLEIDVSSAGIQRTAF